MKNFGCKHLTCQSIQRMQPVAYGSLTQYLCWEVKRSYLYFNNKKKFMSLWLQHMCNQSFWFPPHQKILFYSQTIHPNDKLLSDICIYIFLFGGWISFNKFNSFFQQLFLVSLTTFENENLRKKGFGIFGQTNGLFCFKKCWSVASYNNLLFNTKNNWSKMDQSLNKSMHKS
jgi:hypothetical protein